MTTAPWPEVVAQTYRDEDGQLWHRMRDDERWQPVDDPTPKPAAPLAAAPEPLVPVAPWTPETPAADRPAALPSAAEWRVLDIADLTGPEHDSEADQTFQWLLHGYLEPQTRMILAGDEGGGKSLLLMQICVQLAAGLAPLPGAATAGRPLRVLVIDTELHERTVKRRLTPMARHAQLPAGQLLYVLAPAGIDLTESHSDRAQFARLVLQARPDVIALDSLYRSFNGDPDDPKVIGTLQRLMDQTRDRTGAALILTAHYRKRSSDGKTTRTLDDLAGSRLMKAWPEIVLDVAKDKLRILKDREGIANELLLTRHPPGTWESNDTGWPFTLTTKDEDEQNRPAWQGHTQVQHALLGFLSELDDGASLSSNQVVAGIKDRRAQTGAKGYRRETVLAALGELQDKKHVDWTPGSRAGEQLWFITPTGLSASSTDAPATPGTTGSHDPGNQSEPVGTSPPVTGSQDPLPPYGEGDLGNRSRGPVPNPGTTPRRRTHDQPT